MKVNLLPTLPNHGLCGPIECEVEDGDKVTRVLVPWPLVSRTRNEEIPVTWEALRAEEIEAVMKQAARLYEDKT